MEDSPRFLESVQEFWKILGEFLENSEYAFLFKAVWKQFQQVARVVVVVFVYVCEEMVQPLAHIDLCQFAASHEGVDDSSVFGSIMVAAKEIVLAS